MKSEQLQIRVTREQRAALKRRARRAGQGVSAYVLTRVLPPAHAAFERLLDGLRKRPDDRRFLLAELNDLLSRLAPGELGPALAGADVSRLPELVQNQVAAMVEQAAAQRGVEAPSWVRDVEPLERPHFAAPLKGLRLYLIRVSPVPFRRRNLFVDAGVGDRA